jgi:hypothetical protein
MLLQRLLGGKVEPMATIYGDNQGALLTVKNLKEHLNLLQVHCHRTRKKSGPLGDG